MTIKQVRDPLVPWISDHWVGDDDRSAGEQVFGVLRLPFDYAVSFRPGARLGPDAIVDALNGLSLYCTDKRVSLEDVRLRDMGEVDAVHSLPDSYAAIADAVAALPRDVQPLFLGGDHSITDPIVRGLQRRHPDRRLGLIVFDAHFDSREPIEGREHSGHWVRTLGDVLDYGAVAQIGISAGIYSDAYMRQAEDDGVLVRTPYDARRAGWPRVIEEVLAHAGDGTDGVYLSVDIDCIDKAFAPGTSSANPAGLLAHEVMDAVFEVSRGARIVGFDIVEVSPPLDQLDYTAQVGAQIVLNHIAGVVAGANEGK